MPSISFRGTVDRLLSELGESKRTLYGSISDGANYGIAIRRVNMSAGRPRLDFARHRIFDGS